MTYSDLKLSDPHYVYEFYAEDGTCLYVGCSGWIGARIQQHHGKPWWPDVARIEVKKHENFDVARQVEKDLIQLLSPAHNRFFLERPVRTPWEIEVLHREEIHADGGMCSYQRCDRCSSIRSAELRKFNQNHTSVAPDP